LDLSDKATCEFCLGQIAWETSTETEKAIVHVQRAVSFAEGANKLWQACFFRLRLMVMVTDTAGPAAALAILSQLRREAVKLGDPIITAALHIFIGETETKRGLLRSAERHARLGREILSLEPNLWLDCMAETTFFASAVFKSDVQSATARAEYALRLAREAGAASMYRACLGNLGVIHHMAGHFESALTSLRECLTVLPQTSERTNACYDAIARVYLSEKKYDEADRFLCSIEKTVKRDSDLLLWGNRYSRLTRAEWLFYKGLIPEATAEIERAIDLASRCGDRFLLTSCSFVRAQVLASSGQAPWSVLYALASDLPKYSADFHAKYETTVALALVSEGRLSEAARHFERAENICEQVKNVAVLFDVRTIKDLAFEISAKEPPSKTAGASDVMLTPENGAANAIQNVSSLLLHVGRPELVASDVVALLTETNAATKVKIGSRSEANGLTNHSVADLNGAPLDAIEIGVTADEATVVSFEARRDAESVATINAVRLLLDAARDLERAHAEREERLTLWPIEEEPDDEGDGVIVGHMRELMSFAKRVAKTNIGVLITGESGTGKEILARAVHKYSNRADKPFMPFNCTAIPRDMLESQLFGHRRGAFTSADRDNPGLIRAARGGTLFLDEIGELGLDLQPKLLRFLESGEISPLGETAPVTVDVRILAATNRDLETLVREERFREDLFYRLNVIRLTILPLRERRDEIPTLVYHFVARAARDLGKGQIRVAEETMERFLLYPWPGNIRQMQNEIRRVVTLADVDGVITPDILTHDIRKAGPRPASRRDGSELTVPLTDKLMPTLAHVEREMIRVALKNSHGRLETAARALGISRKGLYLKRQRLGI
jgi:DNA-binding NtrC family response regulator